MVVHLYLRMDGLAIHQCFDVSIDGSHGSHLLAFRGHGVAERSEGKRREEYGRASEGRGRNGLLGMDGGTEGRMDGWRKKKETDGDRRERGFSFWLDGEESVE